MQEHSMTHIKNGTDFDCPITGCEMRFEKHPMLRSHLDKEHIISAKEQAKCKLCTLHFSTPHRLLLHYQTKHDRNESTMVNL